MTARVRMGRLVRHSDMERSAIGIGIDRDARNARLSKSANNTNRDLSPICDEHLPYIHSITFNCTDSRAFSSSFTTFLSIRSASSTQDSV